jgi:ClpP class serine protease
MRATNAFLPAIVAGDWLGTQESFENYKAIKAKIDSGEIKAGAWDDDEDEEDTLHPLVQMQGNVAIVNIVGGLIFGSAGWAMYYGYATGYEDIKSAVLTAIAGGAKAFVYKFHTGGGSVMGLGACGEFMGEVGKKYPSVGYTDSACFSAGVWLAAATRDFRIGKFAKVGSIGVIQVLEDRSEMYKAEGITHDVFRSSPLKGIGTGVEPLTKEAKAYLQKGIDEASQQFTDHLASSLNLSASFVGSQLSTGEIWQAPQARELGLVKKIQSLDQIVVELQKKTGNNANTLAGSYKNPMAAISTLEGSTNMANKPKTLEQAEAEAAAAAEDLVEAPKAETPLAADPAPVPAASAETPVAQDAVTKMLADAQASLMDYAGKVALLQAKVTELEAKVTTFSNSEKEVAPFMASYIVGMTVKAGHSAPDATLLAAQPLNSLVTMAASAKAAFHTSFAAASNGRVSATNPTEDDTPIVNAITDLQRTKLGLSTL